MQSRLNRALSWTLCCAVVLLGLTGCGAAVTTEAAPHATDTACSMVLAQLKGVTDVNGLPRNEVTGQATAAWGEGALRLRCGLDPLGPSTDMCQTVGDVDWVVREQDGDVLLTTFGRAPAVELRAAGPEPAGLDVVLNTLSPAVATLPANGRNCI